MAFHRQIGQAVLINKVDKVELRERQPVRVWCNQDYRHYSAEMR